ncbi:hypothetical protein KKE34_00805 [Patescibacteria group bacterium]|nr:hypothetical protein [Patescibacteria group bacterium]
MFISREKMQRWDDQIFTAHYGSDYSCEKAQISITVKTELDKNAVWNLIPQAANVDLTKI